MTIDNTIRHDHGAIHVRASGPRVVLDIYTPNGQHLVTFRLPVRVSEPLAHAIAAATVDANAALAQTRGHALDIIAGPGADEGFRARIKELLADDVIDAETTVDMARHRSGKDWPDIDNVPF